jgi:hypothetical protein
MLNSKGAWLVSIAYFFLFSCKTRRFTKVNEKETGSKNSLSICEQKLVEWETQANAVTAKSPLPVELEHYEIPLAVLEKDESRQGFASLKQILQFERNGQTFVRWIVNADDTRWYKEVETWLKSKNLDATRKKFFTGYRSASRSFFVKHPETGEFFSLKSSTNNSGGNWQDKKQEWQDAKEIRIINEHVERVSSKVFTKNALFLSEPVAYGIKEIDQGIIVRNYDILKGCKVFLLPGFAAVNEQVGREIANTNASNDPFSFWTENYIVPAAKAITEVLVQYGFALQSPHSQNYLIELSPQFKPTGRIVFRDFVDSELNENYLQALGLKKLQESWEPDVLKNQIRPHFGPVFGNEVPSWVSEVRGGNWPMRFCEVVAETFAELTGLLQSNFDIMRCGLDHSYKDYIGWYTPQTLTKAFEPWYQKAHCFSGIFTPSKTISDCSASQKVKLRD